MDLNINEKLKLPPPRETVGEKNVTWDNLFSSQNEDYPGDVAEFREIQEVARLHHLGKKGVMDMQMLLRKYLIFFFLSVSRLSIFLNIYIYIYIYIYTYYVFTNSHNYTNNYLICSSSCTFI
jgi:hypothetical protein